MPREVRKYMTDEELVERLLDWPYQGETMVHEAADRIKQLTAERDKAYASGYNDAETEISKSALGQDNIFLHSQYTNAKLRIEALTVERDDAWAYMSALQGDLYDAIMMEVERDRLREALERIAKSEPRPKRSRDYDRADVSALQRIARFALKGETP